MHISISTALLGLVSLIEARSALHVGREAAAEVQGWRRIAEGDIGSTMQWKQKRALRPQYSYHKRAGTTIIPQNANTTKFAVNGQGIPEVDFDIGESYAGLLPLSHAANETREFYFWFFPSSNPDAGNEVTIWLNGGPGCSSLEGLFQEAGPVVWQYGTYKPAPNPWSFRNLTNTIFIEQPLGTGFDQGRPTATNETTVAQQFLGFWEVFMDTFALQNRKVYITGESYAGKYIPYIADAMLNQKDKTYFNLKGIQINDPSTSSNTIQRQIPAWPFAQYHHSLFTLNDSISATIDAMDKSCGFAAYRDKYLTYPPPGPLPTPSYNATTCNVYSTIEAAVMLTNPCFDVYQVATTCPILFDPLGFPGSFDYVPEGFQIYFNRTDVQKAINAPIMSWEECSPGVLNRDTSPASSTILGSVVDRLQRTVVAHGQLDYILIANGTLLMLQNVTWGGKQGFQKKPKAPFYVPYHPRGATEALAASGVMGTTHTERGLTWVETWLSGHMIPQYQPTASFRQLEFLLGRIPSLHYVSDFTTQQGNFGNTPAVAAQIAALAAGDD